MAEPTEKLDRILKAVTWIMRSIKPLNGYSTTVSLADEVDAAIRDEDLGSGIVVLVTDEAEDYEFRTARQVRSRLSYRIDAWIRSDSPVTLKATARLFQRDAWKALQADLYLEAADFQASGAPGTKLVVTNKLLRVEREYAPPDAVVSLILRAEYDFDASGT